MALRLTDLVVRGEIFNTQWYSVHGWLELRGQESPLHLELTGNCGPDLAGWHFRFTSRAATEEAAVESQADVMESAEQGDSHGLAGLAWQQIGPTGTMTAARKVKVADRAPGVPRPRFELREQSPREEWKRSLFLEWFSQNGRVVVELADPILEFVEFVEVKGVPPADGESPILPGDEEDEAVGAMGITAIEVDEDGETQVHDFSPTLDEEEEIDEEEPDPYRLIPEELEKALDSQSLELDRAIHQDDELSRCTWETELMDDLIERSDGEPLASLFDNTLRFRRPDQLDDNEVEVELKSLLSQLALFGVSLDVCEHFTPRDVYRLLVEKVCPQERAYPELRGTQWVQHFATSDFCRSCEDEFQREYEEEELRRKDRPDGDAGGDADDSDAPF